MASSDSRNVVDEAAGLIRRARTIIPNYAGARAPAGTWEISKLASEIACEVFYYPFQSSDSGQAFPEILGICPVFIDNAVPATAQMLFVRHELGHRLRGDQREEPVMLNRGDTAGHAERVVDLFAVADLVPTWLMKQLRGGRRPWKSVSLEVALAFRELTDGWGDIRVRDRAALRVQLYREHGI